MRVAGSATPMSELRLSPGRQAERGANGARTHGVARATGQAYTWSEGREKEAEHATSLAVRIGTSHLARHRAPGGGGGVSTPGGQHFSEHVCLLPEGGRAQGRCL